MKHIDTNTHHGYFRIILQSASAQSAMMVLKPGESSSDDVENEHPGAQQWLFVISGAGRARVGGRSVRLGTGSLLLIEKREIHKVTNNGTKPLVTLNFYVPPAYTRGGKVKSNVLPS